MSSSADILPEHHRALAIRLFNRAWELMDRPQRTAEEDDALLGAAHASLYHWSQVGGPPHRARGHWQISRVSVVLGHGAAALHHARRCLVLCQENALTDWDLAFAYEALARAHHQEGRADEAAAALAQARAVPIARDQDRQHLLNELASIG